MMEPRISIYGRNSKEWTGLGKWIIKNRLLRKEVRWMVQLPRLYKIYKKLGLINSFQDLLDNFFKPLFEVTKNPSIDKNLHLFLQHMVVLTALMMKADQRSAILICLNQKIGQGRKIHRIGTGCTIYGQTFNP